MVTSMRIILRVGAALVAIYVLALLALFLGQRALVFKPDTTRPVIADTAADGHARVAKTTTQDGLQLEGWLFEAENSPAPAILFFHGNVDNHGAWDERGRLLQKNGYTILIAGYRGYGGNAGTPSEDGLYKDARAWADWMRATYPNRPIIVYGMSLGTGVASKLAAEQEFTGVVLEVPYTSIADLGQRQYPYFPVKALSRDPFDTLSRIDEIAEPILIMGAGRDNIVPRDHIMTLYDHANDPKTLYFEPESEHNTLYEFDGFAYTDRFIKGLDTD